MTTRLHVFFPLKISFKYKWYLLEALENTEFQETQEGEAGQPRSRTKFLVVLFLISSL